MRKITIGGAVGIACLSFAWAGCAKKMAAVNPTTPPMAEGNAAAEALAARAAETGDRGAAAAAIAQAQKDIAAAKEAGAALFAYDDYVGAQDLLKSAQGDFDKNHWSPAKTEAEQASAKAREAMELAEKARAGKTYAVRKGDCLWNIAEHRLQDPFLWPAIYRANLDLIRDPNLIYPKWSLMIPKNVTDGTALAAKKEAYAFPGPETAHKGKTRG